VIVCREAKDLSMSISIIPAESERTECAQCQASILIATARRHDGLCKPCYKRALYERIGESPFGRAYEIAFRRPRVKTTDLFFLWHDWLDMPIAPFLFQIRHSGHCDDIFLLEKKGKYHFENIEEFEDWCLAVIGKFRSKVIGAKLDTAEAKAEKEVVLQKAQEITNAVSLACEILREREQLRLCKGPS
jgi:hypothetical protein